MAKNLRRHAVAADFLPGIGLLFVRCVLFPLHRINHVPGKRGQSGTQVNVQLVVVSRQRFAVVTRYRAVQNVDQALAVGVELCEFGNVRGEDQVG